MVFIWSSSIYCGFLPKIGKMSIIARLKTTIGEVLVAKNNSKVSVNDTIDVNGKIYRVTGIAFPSKPIEEDVVNLIVFPLKEDERYEIRMV